MGSEIAFARPDDQTLEVRLAGDWLLAGERPSALMVVLELELRPARRVKLLAQDVGAWDSGLLTFVRALVSACRERSIEVDRAGLPKGAAALVALAEAVPEQQGARRAEQRPSGGLARIGSFFLAAIAGGAELLEFLGSVTLALGRFVGLRARYQRRDLWYLVQQCGVEALPIVGLIAFLVGLILAFVGAVQLRQFGAQIYVADLVGLGMAREMGAMMTGIIMAGRTGAAFAAQLGTMKVNEEIDALVTVGIPPTEYLVLPRLVALFLMMPLLCICADLIGIIGGGLVGVGMLDVEPVEYVRRTLDAISLTDCALGVVKGAVFGVIVAVAGCLRGMQTKGSAAAVGDAATSAVVTGIVAIVAADGLFAVLTNVLRI
jgi:phospholipid/cholesterol/gamma-HCH transport system permease protein